MPQTVAEDNASLVMVLDSSGSMAEDDGSDGTRIESARRAVGAVVDALPGGHPTGLRVYGADREAGCTDTRLVRPVEPLDRAAVERVVAEVEPRGDAPIGPAPRRAAEDLPGASGGSPDRRTIPLVSDGEDTCGTPDPCEVAAELGGQGRSSGSAGSSGTPRSDAIGFQVDGKAREQLECIARAGHGSYYDAPDVGALARRLQRVPRLSADGYRMEGERITGGRTADDLAVTAVPRPGCRSPPWTASGSPSSRTRGTGRGAAAPGGTSAGTPEPCRSPPPSAGSPRPAETGPATGRAAIR
ncbi:vWA domain-containing protein [Streptomyces verrucosisporus]|uniref:vWA domain-containing protein n=1 Tax=Streptomyces verrucosisporus TaxID=1695161 RepID=UPI001F122C8E|nr:VWA domain-containing protein [Streptomyces verrucosisporus]